MFSNGPLHTDEQVLADQQELINNSSVRTLDVVMKTCRKWWNIETNGKTESGKSMQAARHEDDDKEEKRKKNILNNLKKCLYRNKNKTLHMKERLITFFFFYVHSLVGWGCTIYRLHLCRGARPPLQRLSKIWHWSIGWWGSSNAGTLEKAK